MAMDINSPIAIAACAVRMDNDASYFLAKHKSHLLVIGITASCESRMLSCRHLQQRSTFVRKCFGRSLGCGRGNSFTSSCFMAESGDPMTGWLYVCRQSAMVSTSLAVTSHCTSGGME
jgi:hypothetical protein